jgi:TetR/AcrR family transcriptional regulator, transcriptional repressor for nem operon
MGRTSDARERLVETAFRLWFRRSYADVGVSEICAEAGVQKGSFYHFFPSKTELAVAVVDEIWRRFQQEVAAKYLHDDTRPPLERLERLLLEHDYRFACAGKAETGHVWGCPVGNLAVELSTQDEALRERLHVFFTGWAAALTELLDEAVEAGELEPHDTHTAGFSLLAYVQGMTVLAKAGNDPELIRTIGPTIVAIAGATATAAA